MWFAFPLFILSFHRPCAPRRPRWSLSHYFGRDPPHSMHLANEFGLTALASVSSSRPPQFGGPRPKNSIGPSARALPSVATDITMNPSHLHLRHSVPAPSSITFAAPLPGNSLRCARVPLVSLTALICLISFFFARCCLGKVRAERPSVSYTKVSAVSLGLANSCNYTNRNKFKQNSGSNKLCSARPSWRVRTEIPLFSR